MQDILLNTDYDLKLTADGDVIMGESTQQHQALLLLVNKGDLKESPTCGVGMVGWLKSEDVKGLLAETKTEFEKDGMHVKNIRYKGGDLKIIAPYNDDTGT